MTTWVLAVFGFLMIATCVGQTVLIARNELRFYRTKQKLRHTATVHPSYPEVEREVA